MARFEGFSWWVHSEQAFRSNQKKNVFDFLCNPYPVKKKVYLYQEYRLKAAIRQIEPMNKERSTVLYCCFSLKLNLTNK